jgi:nitroreductase
MDFCELIRTRRSIRRFKPLPVDRSILMELLEAARAAPSAGNRQPLEYVVVVEPGLVGRVFEQLAWAALVQPRRNPPEGSRPPVYIVVLVNNDRQLGNFGRVDAAAAIENMLLAAWSKGIGSCWIGSVQREKLGKVLAIPANLEIDSVVALGWPDEQPVMEDAKDDSERAVRYYLDQSDRLCVPKRLVRSVCYLDRYGEPID